MIRELKIDSCEKGLFNGVQKQYTEEDLRYSMGEDNYILFKQEYDEMSCKK